MITLYHAGYDVIQNPDIHYGRKNADFGQGFYVTDNLGFARGWVREKPGAEVIINHYELTEDDLKIKKLERNREWFEYIFENRRLKPDRFAEYDLIIGPIANDTIYETFGIMTSGFLSDEEALKLMMVGKSFTQVVLKSSKAIRNLKFLTSEILSKEIIETNKKIYLKENEAFQSEFAKAMQELA